MRSDVLEIAWSAIFLCQEGLTSVELAGCTARTFGRIWAVEVGDMAVTNISEPA